MGTALTMRLISWLTWCILLACQAGLSTATFNLFLPVFEVRNLLGLSGELWYVEDGVFRPKALDFVIPLSTKVDNNHFVWFDKGNGERPYYNLKVSTSDPLALHQPHINISHHGIIPKKVTTWRLSLPCSGLKSGHVEVVIFVTIRGLPGKPETSFKIRRQKECVREAGRSDSVFANELEPNTPPHVVFLWIVLGAFIFALLLAAIIVACHFRYRRGKTGKLIDGNDSRDSSLRLQHQMHELHQNPRQETQTHQYQLNSSLGLVGLPQPTEDPQMQMPFMPLSRGPPLPPANPPPAHLPSQMRMYDLAHTDANLMSDAESRVTDWVQSQMRQKENDPQQVMKMLHVDRLRLKLGQLLMEGTFGRVYQGTLLLDEHAEEDVYIKTVIAGSSPNQSQTLIKEGTALQGLAHNHIETLLATTWDGTSPMLVYPLQGHGNLRKFLLQNSHGGFSTHVVVSLGLQMLKAMQHLHRRKIIHKDIATRNCILGEGNLLKLSDSALSRDLFPGDYHCLGDNENRPIKWMPMEAIGQKKYSKASDVWSFGVFEWEVMTRAQQPFADIDPFEMEAYLLDGYRLHQPQNCPDQLYSVLASCWAFSPQERPTVHTLYNQLQQLQRQLQQFV